MSDSETFYRCFWRVFSWLGIGLGALSLVLTGAFLCWEASWVERRELTPQEAFLTGTIGTEIAPLAVVKVLPSIVPEAFRPAGDMTEQFGFLARAADDPAAGLPYGMTVSNYRPLSGAPSPIPFVGVGCSACHTTELRNGPDGAPRRVSGAGNARLDLIGWGNAVQAAIMARDPEGEWVLTMDRIVEASGEDIPLIPDRIVISVWLSQARAAAEKLAQTYDEKQIGPAQRDSRFTPEGPGRTKPFASLVRRLLNRPGHDPAYSKIPAVFNQGAKEWAQFDGSIRSDKLRSGLAAMTIQASRENMAQPEIGRNVTGAAVYLRDLKGPTFAETFPEAAPDPDAAARGAAVYGDYCAACHGAPGADGWDSAGASRFGEVIPLGEIGTDPVRVTFRHAAALSAAIVDYMSIYPEGHPFRTPPSMIRPNPEDPDSFVPGYLAAPIDSAFARAPYLHNASVLSMAELINLEPRRTRFCRGRAIYDVERLGLAYVAPSADAEGRPACDLASPEYFLFDAGRAGNGSSGHDYPWAYGAPGWNEAELRDLLAYLKTF